MRASQTWVSQGLHFYARYPRILTSANALRWRLTKSDVRRQTEASKFIRKVGLLTTVTRTVNLQMNVSMYSFINYRTVVRPLISPLHTSDFNFWTEFKVEFTKSQHKSVEEKDNPYGLIVLVVFSLQYILAMTRGYILYAVYFVIRWPTIAVVLWQECYLIKMLQERQRFFSFLLKRKRV